MPSSLTVVLDVGKTTAKTSLWTPEGECIRRDSRANQTVDAGGYPALDAEGIESWLADVLTDLAQVGPIGSIIPVAHGAAAAIVRNGKLAAPPMDYEFAPPGAIRDSYIEGRDPFVQNGSPMMGMSLNLGLQLHYLEQLYPRILGQGAIILPWAQYWSWRLCGVAACEVSSLGSHTDLWSPWTGEPSPMAARRGWAARLAPMRRATELLGVLLPEWVERTGLPRRVGVYAGVHDSNAALGAARAYPEISTGDASIVSTGTWFVAMRSPGRGADLSEQRRAPGPACLINVDPGGAPVPTALFMGGRETELLCEDCSLRLDDEHLWFESAELAGACVETGAMVLPTMAPGTGPFPDHPGSWVNRPGDRGQAAAAIALYAALVVDHALDRIGARDRLLVEGRFARLPAFVRGLAALRRDFRVFTTEADSDVSFGALQLLRPEIAPPQPLKGVRPLDLDLNGYRALWRRRLGLIG